MKLKAVLIGLVLIFVTGLFVKINFLKIERDNVILDRDRLQLDVYELMKDTADKRTIILNQKEVNGKLKHERDSTAKANNVRKQDILRISYQNISLNLTSSVNIPIKPIAPNSWSFSDTIDKCTVYSGEVILSDSTPTVKRTGFSYQNKITEVYYRKAPHIWFVRTGKYKNYVEKRTTCGNITTEEFNFIK